MKKLNILKASLDKLVPVRVATSTNRSSFHPISLEAARLAGMLGSYAASLEVCILFAHPSGAT